MIDGISPYFFDKEVKNGRYKVGHNQSNFG